MTTTVPSALDVRIEQGLSDLRAPVVRQAMLDEVRRAYDDLDSGRFDVVIFAARRMLCLVEVLRALGLPEPRRGRVTSDRFLEVLPDSAWKGEKVLLVDDTRLTGLTLRAREAILARLVGDPTAVETRVVLDPPSNLVTVESRLEWLERTAGEDLHAQFAAVFGRNLVPYFTDFAVSMVVSTGVDALFELLTQPDWQVAEVTNAALAGSGARSFSLFPRAEMRDRLTAHLGPAAGVIEVAKARVFTRPTPEGIDVRVVPVVLIRSFTADVIDRLLASLPGAPRGDAAREQFAGLATFSLSETVLRFLSTEFADVLGSRAREDLDHRDLVLGAAAAFLEASWPWDDLIEERSISSSKRHPRLVDDGESVLIGDDAVRHLIERFDALAKRNPAHLDRERFSLHTLAKYTNSDPVDLSIALDVGNDLGTVVPSHLVSDGRVHRAFRPGESTDRTHRPGPMGGIYASVPETLRLDDHLRPIAWLPVDPDGDAQD